MRTWTQLCSSYQRYVATQCHCIVRTDKVSAIAGYRFHRLQLLMGIYIEDAIHQAAQKV